MATNFIGVLLPSTPNYTVNAGFSTQLYDATGGQTITVQAGASLQLLGSIGTNTLRLNGNTNAWQVYHDGSTVVLTSTDGSRVELAATTEIQTLHFDDGSRDLKIDTANGPPALLLGTQTLSTEPSAIGASEQTPPDTTDPDTPDTGSTTKAPWTLLMTGNISSSSGSGWYTNTAQILVSDGTAAGTDTQALDSSYYSSVRFVVDTDQTSAYFHNKSGSWSNGDVSGSSTSWVGYTDGTLAGTYTVVHEEYIPTNLVLLTDNKLVLAGHDAPRGSGKAYVVDGAQQTYTTTALDYAVPSGYSTVMHDEAQQNVWFDASSPPYGRELVRFDYQDITQLSSSLIEDIYPGTDNGLQEYGGLAVALLSNGKLVFAANDGIHGREAWVSDGTEAGTFMLKDFYDGDYGDVSSFITYSNKVAFSATAYNWGSNGDIPYAGRELAFTDGTTDGTTLLDVNPGGSGSYPALLGEANGLLYFTADAYDSNSGNTQRGIYSTNGSTFTKLATINSDATLLGWDAHQAFFKVSDATHGAELWVANFSTNSFGLVKDILAGSGSALASSYGYTGQMGAGKLIFTAYTSAAQQGLFVSDGTAAGTVQVGDGVPTSSKVIGNTQVFTNAEGVFAVDLEATAPAAVQLGSSELLSTYTSLQTDADQAFYLTSNGGLFSTAGTSVSTVPLASQVSQFKVVAEDALFFVQHNTASNTQSLWYSDGTAAGTRFIEDLPDDSYFDLANAVAIKTVGVVTEA